jgi:hypothetical protein
MTAKGTPAYYAARRQQPTPKPPDTERNKVVTCPNAACTTPYLSYHLKCPFCGTAV